MLKLRVLTIAVLAPLAIAAILLLPNNFFSYLMVLCIAVAAYEWGRLAGLSGSLSLVVLTGALLVLDHFQRDLYLQSWIYWLAASWWVVACYSIVQYQRGISGGNINKYMKLMIGFVVLLPPWFAIVGLHDVQTNGPQVALYIFLIFWFADIGAYIAGRSIGRTKLAPNVSPGKTLEGVYGAAVAVILLAIGGAYYFDFKGEQFAVFVLISVLAAAVSIIGDLYESLLKRAAGVKDSGRILPGHGGMLDRIDSLTAGAPIFALGYWLLLI